MPNPCDHINTVVVDYVAGSGCWAYVFCRDCAVDFGGEVDGATPQWVLDAIDDYIKRTILLGDNL